MLRSVLGVVVGVLVWMVGFYAFASALARLWPDYAVHAREWVRAGVFTFTAAMAVCNIVLWVLAEAVAGWATRGIARRQAPVWVLVALIGVYLASLHLVLYWARFPWWYNLGVVATAAPAVLLGAMFAGGSRPAPAVSGR